MVIISGKWFVVQELQGGGLGQVFKCRAERGGLFVGKFPRDFGSDTQSMIDDEARRLQRHQGPGVVHYLGPLTLADGRRGYAMELMQGDMAGFLTWGRILSPAEALVRLSPVVDVLARLHGSASGAFHGDVKLKNILYREQETKLADFGLARGGIGQTMMVGPHGGGTPGYMPPEKAASPAGDVYSTGAVLWALLVGREPLPNEALRIGIPRHPKLESLLNQMLAPSWWERPLMLEVQHLLPSAQTEARGIANEQKWTFGLWGALGFAVALLVVGAKD